MAPSRALRTQARATRAKPAFSYAELSSDDDIYGEEGEHSNTSAEEHMSSPSRSSRRRLSTRPQSNRRRLSPTLTSNYEIVDVHPHKKYKQSKKVGTLKAPSVEQTETIIPVGNIPPWQSLPYHILLQVFQYAAYPLYDSHTFYPLPSGTWLLKVARLCRAFAEPAFTALYTSPPLIPMNKAHMLADILKADPTSMAFKYRQKVESLRIEVGLVAACSLQGYGHLDLHGLVKNLPRLTELEFYHEKDMPPYRNLDETIKWNYPENLFEALEYVSPNADSLRGDKVGVCKLMGWRWSSRLAGKKYPLEKLHQMHLKPSLIGLRKLSFVNYQLPATVKGDEDPPSHEKILAMSLAPLKNLEHLIFESSTLVNGTLLSLLPKGLRNLEIINCWELKADELAEFLITHGTQLRCLTLNHNQFLSLSFLPILGTACPKLQVFRMNLSYFNIHSSYRDSDPLYEYLLLPGEVPSWPSTLQTIELIQLRKWGTEAAETFFSSLLDNAESLLDLRRLTIQAILNIGWRDRASFRDKWIGALDRVFKRISDPPNTFVRRSENTYVIPATQQRHETRKEITIPTRESRRLNSAASLKEPTHSTFDDAEKSKSTLSLSSRRSVRTSTRDARTGIYMESPDNSDNEEHEYSRLSLTGPDNSRLVRELRKLEQTPGTPGAKHPLAPFDNAPEEDSDEVPLIRKKAKGKAVEVIQGMCEIVDIRIDNLRPRETQLTEANFLDEEAPGDGDWNGEDDMDDGYAW